jgi:hypothetical protein
VIYQVEEQSFIDIMEIKMEYGMMWFDDSPKTRIAEKITQAIDYYRKKYGDNPDICFVNPSMLEAPIEGPKNITISPLHSIMRWHFWIGQLGK